jgi:hypothetical protein
MIHRWWRVHRGVLPSLLLLLSLLRLPLPFLLLPPLLLLLSLLRLPLPFLLLPPLLLLLSLLRLPLLLLPPLLFLLSLLRLPLPFLLLPPLLLLLSLLRLPLLLLPLAIRDGRRSLRSRRAAGRLFRHREARVEPARYHHNNKSRPCRSPHGAA